MKNFNLGLIIVAALLVQACASTQSLPMERQEQVRVTSETYRAPYDNVCHLSSNRSTGSAVLIEGRYLITAAHNLSDYSGFSRVKRLEVRCGVLAKEGAEALVFDRPEIKKNRAIPRYSFNPLYRRAQFKNDYAFFDLGKVISAQNHFQLSAFPAGTTMSVSIAGYPGGSVCDNCHMLFVGKGETSGAVHRSNFEYNVTTATGNSGGPVWYEKPNGKYALAGIHVAPSRARVVDDVFLDDWKNWVDGRAND